MIPDTLVNYLSLKIVKKESGDREGEKMFQQITIVKNREEKGIVDENYKWSAHRYDLVR